MPRTAKLFKNGRSQAVRLPSEFRFEGEEVFIRKDEHTGDVILSRRPASRDEFFSLREEARKADPRAFEDSLPTAKMNRHTTASCSDHERSLFVGHQCCQLRHHEKEP